MGTSILGNAGETKTVQYLIGNCIFEKQICITESGFKTIPGTERFLRELPVGKTNLKNFSAKQRSLSPCPA